MEVIPHLKWNFGAAQEMNKKNRIEGTVSQDWIFCLKVCVIKSELFVCALIVSPPHTSPTMSRLVSVIPISLLYSYYAFRPVD
jgi:hypothetical protein